MNESCQSLSIFEVPLEAVGITLKKKFPAILTVGTNRGENLTISSHFYFLKKKRKKIVF